VDLKAELKARCEIVDETLEKLVPGIDCEPSKIHDSMRYSLFAGGKRLRPVLTMITAELLGLKAEKVLPTACALELIHTYSLIHDDLPAMDNDDFRRGKPTNHRVYGEAIAVLAGDGLLTLAFDLIAQNGEIEGIEAKRVLQVIKEVAYASGSQGMIGGQVVDTLSENQIVNLETLEYIHKHKTGALYKAAIKAGAILAGAHEDDIKRLENYADCFGLAFQITDDILDVIGDAELIGKPVGSDEKNQKATYPAIFGLEKSREMAQEAVDNAITALDKYGSEADILRELALYLLNRKS
jgi:geranylgeranyl diphosphate synthase, type II